MQKLHKKYNHEKNSMKRISFTSTKIWQIYMIYDTKIYIAGHSGLVGASIYKQLKNHKK